MLPETICANCEHMHKPNQSDPFYRWLCLKHKRMQGMNPVTGDDTLLSPPYLYCKDVNGGACPLFERKK